MLPIPSPAISLFEPIRYSKTELADKRIHIDSLRHQRSDYSMMVVLFQSGLVLKNLAHFKQFDDDLNSHMERSGEFALTGYLIRNRLSSQPAFYTKEPLPMHRPIDIGSDIQRHVVVEKSLASLLPITSIDLVNDYVPEVPSALFDTDTWSKPVNCSLKRNMIRLSLEYGNEQFLNETFEQLRNSGQPIDLTRVDLSGLNLSKLNLAGVILVRANLTCANLTGVNLSKADLSFADFTNAILINANLSGATLISANLTFANCEFINLKEANLTKAILSRTNMRCGALQRAVFADAIMTGINLSYAKLDFANLQRAVLYTSCMVEATLEKADMSKAKLNLSHMVDTDLSGVNLSDANLGGAYLENVTLLGAILIRTNLFGANLVGTEIDDALQTDCNKAMLLSARFLQFGTVGPRKITIEETLQRHLPTSIIDVVSAYDGFTEARKMQTFSEISNRSVLHFKNPELVYAPVKNIEVRCKDQNFVIEALGADDLILKEQIIRTLVSQNKVGYLNKAFQKLRSSHGVFSLAHIDLSTLNLSNLDLSYADLGGANLSGVTLDFNFMSNFSLAQSNLAGAVISNSHLRQVMLARSDLSGARFENCTIEASWLDEVNLTDSTLCAEFFQVDMRNVDFSRAKFKFASIVESDLTGACMEHAVLNGVHIRDSVLKNVKLDNVRLIDTSKNRTVITDPAQLTD